MPRQIMWCRAPAESILAFLGIITAYSIGDTKRKDKLYDRPQFPNFRVRHQGPRVDFLMRCAIMP